jgi:hypothetical protein
MPINAPSCLAGLHRAVLQVGFAALGVCSAIWAAYTLPGAVLVTRARDVAELVTANAPFKQGALQDVEHELGAAPAQLMATNFVAARAYAIVTLQLAQQSEARDRSDQVESAYALAEHRIRAALRLGPTDSYLWSAAYSVRTARAEFKPSDRRLLAQSYATGPHEGWVAVTRNRLALAAYPMLDDRTKELAITEFAEMIGSGMIEEALPNLLGVDEALRARLLASLTTAPLPMRQALARHIQREGVRVDVPGVQLDERSWR